MGSVEAGLLSSKLINAFRHKLLLMPEICAGMKDKVNYGVPRKKDEMQKYAAYTSAAVLYEFLVRFGWELCTLIDR